MTATLFFALKKFSRHRSALAIAALAMTTVGTRATAQRAGVMGLTTLAGPEDDRVRLRQLAKDSASQRYLIRSVSRLEGPVADTGAFRFGIVAPEIRTIRNSGIPFSLNDGPMFAGRGWNSEATAGAFAEFPHVRIIAAPTIVSEQNLGFQVIPYPQLGTDPRNVWANPFHPLPESIDLPLRFGDKPRKFLDPGQSSVTVAARNVEFGFASQNLWWGPAFRNAITLSSNAAGFPHAFVQMREPTQTRFGTFDAQWVLGKLTESAFFDRDSSNNTRSLNGAILTWRPPFENVPTIGVARLVLATRANNDFPFGGGFDVLRSAGHIDNDSLAPLGDHPRDQITSFFARWLFPRAGFDAYVEWARFEEPISIRDFLEFPGHSEAYSMGFQWAHPLRNDHTFRLQSELDYFEPDPSIRLRQVATTYTSRGVPQGFTQRGQTLGAATGPGSSAQWLAADWVAPNWQFGPYLERVRWDNGVLFEPIVPEFKRQDVTLLAGMRGGVSWKGTSLFVDFAHAVRFDYLYQAYVFDRLNTGGIDIINNTLSVTLSTALSRR